MRMILRWAIPLLCGLAATHVHGQDCQEGWTDEFIHTSIGYQVRVLAAADLGNGPELFAGGYLSTASGFDVNNITRWNGAYWEPLGGGVTGTPQGGQGPVVYAIASYDDGSGPALYVGGNFLTAGGVPAMNVARWNGAQWSAVGDAGLSTVRALAVHDDGGGPALYKAGLPFDGGNPIVARWDGVDWQPVAWYLEGDTYDLSIRALASFDDGSGPALYAAGRFSSIVHIDALSVARWRNGAWEAVGAGFSGGQFSPEPLVATLRVFDDGDGPRLYAGGDFTMSGETPARLTACWDGQSWKEVGGGIPDKTYVSSMAAFDDGAGARLFATANLQVSVGSLYRLDDAGWHSVGDADSGPMFSEATSGERLFVGGSMHRIGELVAGSVAMWDGEAWTGTVPPMGSVSAAEFFDDGSGLALFASSVDCDNCIAGYVRRWDGKQWIPAGDPSPKMVQDFQVFDDGSGPAVYAAGYWEKGEDIYGCVRWNGQDQEWEPVGDPIQCYGIALGVFDRGQGPQLYLSRGPCQEGFDSGVLRLEDGVWFPMPGSPSKLHAPNCFASFDDGTGPALYVGMRGSDGSLGPIARWNGQKWSNIPTPDELYNGPLNIRTMCVHDDGSGPALFVGGSSGAGRVLTTKWDAANWWPLGAGLYKGKKGGVNDIAVGTIDGQKRLLAGGIYRANVDDYLGIASAWNGQEWQPVGGEIVGGVSEVMPVADDDLFLAGSITRVGGVPSNSVAHWRFCPPPCPADCDASGSLDLLDYLCFSALFESADLAADCDASGAIDLFDFLCFVNAFNAGCP